MTELETSSDSNCSPMWTHLNNSDLADLRAFTRSADIPTIYIDTCVNWSSLTHSLTAALDQLRVVASSTSTDLGLQSGSTDRQTNLMSSSTCCNQVLHGRPGGRFQSAAGGVPVWASIDSCSVFSGRRQMWPNNEWRLSAIRDGRSGSFNSVNNIDGFSSSSCVCD